MFENIVLGKILFRPKKAEADVQVRILHNEELGDLCRLHSIVRIVESRML
jgi:hypothetical protein